MSIVLEHPPVAPPAAPAAGGLSSQDVNRLGIVRHLIASMMLGQLYGLRDDVARIFDTTSKMLGDGRALRISLAFASALGGDVTPAHELLSEGMDDWPDAEMSRLSVALALKVGGDPQWTEIAEHALAVSNDDAARRFARQMLDAPISPSSEF
jgi:hypothetical protein